jgi:hypothetical protein
MDWANPKSVETRIARLTKEIGQIESFLYDLDAQDERIGVSALLEHKRDDLVRAAVLQIHTAIEDLLSQIILYCALGITKEEYKNRLRSDKASAFRRMLYGGGSLGFDMKLNFAVGLGLIDQPLRKKLMELNTVRNRCSHNWMLKAVVRHGKRPKQKKPPLLLFRERDLHAVSVLKDFWNEYSVIYLHLYARLVK